jgi:anti-sigma regulatory factor (Ser/Thr protein kinase)
VPEVETRRVGRGLDSRVVAEVRTDERATVTVHDFGPTLRATIRSAGRTRPADLHVTRDEARGVAEALRVFNGVATEEEARYRALAEQATAEHLDLRRALARTRAERDVARRHRERLVTAVTEALSRTHRHGEHQTRTAVLDVLADLPFDTNPETTEPTT